jgi:toxin-antitoxin system PIN domain toxin
MIVDANVLLYAVDATSPFHEPSRDWLESALNGDRRVGLPWSSLWAFVRIATHPRALEAPLLPVEASEFVADWLAAPAAWTPRPGRGHATLVAELLVDLDLRGNLVPDAVLAALCLEHGVPIVSADSDFARFTQVEWINPVAPAA